MTSYSCGNLRKNILPVILFLMHSCSSSLVLWTPKIRTISALNSNVLELRSSQVSASKDVSAASMAAGRCGPSARCSPAPRTSARSACSRRARAAPPPAPPPPRTNHRHGLLLQVLKLLEAKPENLIIDEENSEEILSAMYQTLWIMAQSVSELPCYPLIDEYVKVVNQLIWKFPMLINEEILNKIEEYIEILIFKSKIPPITLGREICLANALYLYIIILSSQKRNCSELILRALHHRSYEVVLSGLNYLLIVYKKLDPENKFQEHLQILSNGNVLESLRNNQNYISSLCNIYKNNKYKECIQKSLEILSLENDTQKYIVATKLNEDIAKITDDTIIRILFECVENEQENLTHLYLKSLMHFISKQFNNSVINIEMLLNVLRLIFACSSSDNNDNVRETVVEFLEENFVRLLQLNLNGLAEAEQFEYKATLWATVVTVLEDDDDVIRQRTSDVIAGVTRTSRDVIASRTGELLRGVIERDGDKEAAVAVLAILALLDFRSEVCATDDIGEECRVFDQNERYNAYLEETIWTHECADKIIQICEGIDEIAVDFVHSIIDKEIYVDTFDKLCNENVISFRNLLKNNSNNYVNKEILNPKISLFFNKLYGH